MEKDTDLVRYSEELEEEAINSETAAPPPEESLDAFKFFFRNDEPINRKSF